MDSSSVRRRRNTLAATTESGEDGDFVQLRLIRQQAQAVRDSSESLSDELASDFNRNDVNATPKQTSSKPVGSEDWVIALFDAIDDQDRKKVEPLLYKARKLRKVPDIRHPKTNENILHFSLSRGWKEFAVELIHKESKELLISQHPIKQSGLEGKRNSLHIATEINDIDIAILILNRIQDQETRLAMMKTETAVVIQGQRPRLLSCLHLAAYYGHTQLAKLFLDLGTPVNFQNGKNDTALLWAARWGHNDTVNLLLDRGADPEIANDKGSTALYWAIRYQLPDTVRLLLTKGRANPNTTRKLGLVAPIIIASAYGNTEIIKELLKCPSIDVNIKIRGGETAVHHAAKEGWLPVVQLLIQKGAMFDEKDDLGDTPLLLAAKHGHVNVVHALVKSGANVNTRNYTGQDIWYFAINSEKNSLLKALINSKITTTSGKNPLCIAASLGKTDKIQFLLEVGCNPNSTDADGNTFLHHAAMNDQSSVIDEFQSVGAMNCQNIAGNTALHIACMKGFPKTITSLLNSKAKADVKNKRGETALHVAACSTNITPEAAKSLVQYTIKSHPWESLNAQDFEGNNCLHIAGKFAKPQVLWEFRFVRISEKDKDGMTPLHEAVRPGEPEALETMLDIFETSKRDASINEQSYETRETVLHLAGEEGHANCVKRLIDLGADIAIQDVNGDTVLHRLIKACVLQDSNISKHLKVIDTIIGRIVHWWCFKNDITIPESLKDKTAILYKKKAVLYIINDVKNNEGLSVLNQAFKSGVPEVLSKLLMMPNVTMEEGAYYKFDVTGLTPRTNKELTVGCCGNPRVTPASEKGEHKNDGVSVSGLELLITNKAAHAADILDLPPVRMIETYYISVVAWTFALLMVFHILYMSIFTYVSLSLLGTLRKNSSNISASDTETVLMYVIVPIEPAIIIIYIVYSIFRIILTKDVFRRSKLIDKSGYKLVLRVTSSYVFLAVCGAFATLVFVWIGMFTQRHGYQDYVLAASLCIGWLLSISFTRGIQAVHYFYKMLLNMILRDVLRFIIVYLFVLLAFAFAFHALFQISAAIASNYSNPASTLFLTFNMMIGMADLFDDTFEDNMSNEGRTTTYAKVLYLIYIILSTIVLLNLLIAMMNDSYSMILSEKAVTWRIESVNMGVEIESTFPVSKTFSKVRIYRGGTDGDDFEADRWFVRMSEADYINCMHELQQKRLASTDAVTKRLDDLESNMTALIKETSEKFQRLTDFLSEEKTHKKRKRKSSVIPE